MARINRLRGRIADQPIDSVVVESGQSSIQSMYPIMEQKPLPHDDFWGSGGDSNFKLPELFKVPKIQQAVSNIQDQYINRQHLYDKG